MKKVFEQWRIEEASRYQDVSWPERLHLPDNLPKLSFGVDLADGYREALAERDRLLGELGEAQKRLDGITVRTLDSQIQAYRAAVAKDPWQDIATVVNFIGKMAEIQKAEKERDGFGRALRALRQFHPDEMDDPWAFAAGPQGDCKDSVVAFTHAVEAMKEPQVVLPRPTAYLSLCPPRSGPSLDECPVALELPHDGRFNGCVVVLTEPKHVLANRTFKVGTVGVVKTTTNVGSSSPPTKKTHFAVELDGGDGSTYEAIVHPCAVSFMADHPRVSHQGVIARRPPPFVPPTAYQGRNPNLHYVGDVEGSGLALDVWALPPYGEWPADSWVIPQRPPPVPYVASRDVLNAAFLLRSEYRAWWWSKRQIMIATLIAKGERENFVKFLGENILPQPWKTPSALVRAREASR